MSKEKTVTFKGIPLYDGMQVEGTIEGRPAKGAIRILESYPSIYFCQDERQGSGVPDGNYLSYKYSWAFNIAGNDKCTAGVVLTSVLNERSYETKEIYSTNLRQLVSKPSNNPTNHYNSISLTETKRVYIKGEPVPMVSEKQVVEFFKTKNHPDCCGCMIAYSFDSSNNLSYSKYKDIDSEDMEKLVSYLKKHTTPILAHLAGYQVSAIELVEKLGFIKRYEYKNPNSRNTIHVYQYQND